MAEFAFDLSALVLPPTAPATLPPPSVRQGARFEDHLGQASRTPRDDAPESSRNSIDRESESESAAAQTPAESGPAAASDRGPDDDSHERESDVEDAAVDPAAKESDSEPDASTHADTTNAAAVAAGAAVGQAGDKSQAKTAIKRRAGDLHEAGVKASDGKFAKPTEESSAGKPGKRSRVSAKGRDAEVSAADKLVEKKDVVTEGSGEEKTPDDKPLTDDQRLAANAAIDLSDQPKAQAGAGQVAEALPKGVAKDTAVQPKANTEARVAAQATEVTAATEASPKRVRGKNDEPIAERNGVQSSRVPEATAAQAPVAAVDAISDIVGDDRESTEPKERPPEDVQPTDRNDKNEPRVGNAPALLVARSDKAHEANGRGDGLTEAERARFVQRVASAFRSVGDEGGEVRLRLSPPELGSLRVELTVRDGVLSARLEAETSAARNLLLDNLPALRERLAEQNIKVEKFDVDVRDERRQSSGEQFAGQPDQGQQGDRQRGRTFDNRPVTAAAVARATRGPIKHGDASELNIVI